MPCKEMTHAFWMMNCTREKTFYKNSHAYNNLRKEYVSSIAGENNYFYGKTPWNKGMVYSE